MAAIILFGKREKKEKKYKRDFRNYKSAEKNIKFDIIDAITYNIIESVTKFKNKEVDNNNLNKEISLNLSFALWKCNSKKKINKEEDKNYILKKNKYPIQNFDIYFPSNRITFLEEAKLNKIKKDKNNNNKNKFDIFLPSSIVFTEKKNKKQNDISNSSENYNSKKSLNSSILSEESFSSSKNIFNISIDSDNIEKNNEENKINKNKKNKKELFDYIECPLIQNKTKKYKIDNLLYLLDKIDDIIELEEINQISYNNINNKKYGIDYNKTNENQELICNNNNIKNEKEDLLDINYITNYLKKKLLISNVNLEIDKKHFKKMNQNYPKLMHDMFMRFLKCFMKNKKLIEETKNLFIKKQILKCFKKLLLSLGISNKNIYEKIFKNYILNDNLFSFDKFIQSFDAIIYDKDIQNMKFKYLFLLNIAANNEKFIDKKNVENFFKLIECDCAYIDIFSENLGQKLLIRYKAIYKNEEKDNILERKYNLNKMRIIVESFFDQIQQE